MCLKSLLAIKSSNESQKRSKDKSQENGNKQLSRNKGANGHKMILSSKQKRSLKQNEHKD